MSYPRFFVTNEAFGDGNVTLKGEAAHHISKSLRMRKGEMIIVCDDAGNEYTCELVAFTDDRVEGKITDMCRSAVEPPYDAVLYQACPKGDKMDTVVQKAVELGAAKIVAFVGQRSIARYDGEGLAKKCARWQKIAEEAAKQSGRGRVPVVTYALDTSQAVGEMTKHDLSFMCYEGKGASFIGNIIKEMPEKKNERPVISFMIGPEGGFSDKEVTLCREAGIHLANLGKRILRTETASGFVLSCLLYEMDKN